MMDHCLNCGGAIGEPNTPYGYAGKWCCCPVNPAHQFRRPASKETIFHEHGKTTLTFTPPSPQAQPVTPTLTREIILKLLAKAEEQHKHNEAQGTWIETPYLAPDALEDIIDYHPEVIALCHLALRGLAAEGLEKALDGLMEAHREVFRSSLFTALRSGKTNFISSWKNAEEALLKFKAEVGE